MNLAERMNEDVRRSEQLQKIERSLTNVTPGMDQVKRIEGLREVGKKLAAAVVWNCPVSREQSLALTKLEECVMFAVKAIVLEGEE